MHIASLHLRNFRCFGDDAVSISLKNLNAFIGTNGAGKTAVLFALLRLFGTTSADRRLLREDFHLPVSESADEVSELSLMIEARLSFPELSDPYGDLDSIPERFRAMTVDAPGEPPYCRIRLTANWSRSNLPDGDIEESLHWIRTPDANPGNDALKPLAAHERNAIHVVYVPATRDPAKQLRSIASGTLHRLLQNVTWSEATRVAVHQATTQINDAIQNEEPIDLIQTAIRSSWGQLHDLSDFTNPALTTAGASIDEVIRAMSFIFSSSISESKLPVERMSDGLKSLFYLTLVAGIFEFQHTLNTEPDADDREDEESEEPDQSLKASDEIAPPVLTVFAVEEPENHVAPHCLRRIMDLLVRLADHLHGQVLVTSHSASIVSRVDPADIRHFRLDPATLSGRVRPIILPDSEDEAFTYVKEAVQAFPELYFSRVVVLCEGDSEQEIIPRAGKAEGIPVDKNLVSVVPLAGRHVNHFWGLLTSLDIPHCTLVDLDLGRETGGWSRIANLVQQLLINDAAPDSLLVDYDEAILEPDTCHDVLVNGDPSDTKRLKHWIGQLEESGVFLSAPLDVDLLMLHAFPLAYQTLQGTDKGPRIPDPKNDQKKYDGRLATAKLRVFGENGKPQKFYDKFDEMFPWYTYLFLDHSKPRTHFESLRRISPGDLKDQLPKVLKRLFHWLANQLQNNPGD